MARIALFAEAYLGVSNVLTELKGNRPHVNTAEYVGSEITNVILHCPICSEPRATRVSGYSERFGKFIVISFVDLCISSCSTLSVSGRRRSGGRF